MSVLIITDAGMVAFNHSKLRNDLRFALDQHERDSFKYDPTDWMDVLPPEGESGAAVVVQ